MESEEQLAPELIVDDVPRSLRRQKPAGARRKKLSERARLFLWSLVVVAAVAAVAAAAQFLLVSPSLRLESLGQVAVVGNHYVGAEMVRQVFAPDRGRSLLRVPLEERRLAIEQIPWVARATVRRVLPDRIEVELAERVPVAFLRQGSSMALVDARGVIFPAPVQGNFSFPVVTGLSSAMPASDRQSRMGMFLAFLAAIEPVRAGATAMLSEVSLADLDDLRATLAPPQAAAALGQGPVLVHFGSGDFAAKFKIFLDNFAQWEAAVPQGGIASVDLRFGQQVIVTPATAAAAQQNETPAGQAAGAER
jgi:cell division protein FtsQ